MHAADPPASNSGTAAGEPPPWRRGLAWLLLLGPFFFLSYGFANWWASQLPGTGKLVFAWEREIPFLAWTIVPYWSIDLLYGLSFLLCRNRRETDTHAFRLLSAQLISVACFILFPLHFSFERPPTDGFFGALFDLLMGFDKPFNQAPSLHISLLAILWLRYAASTRGACRGLVHLWMLLVGASVLTTYQHHFIDIPTGALAGLICLWLWPDHGRSPLADWRLTRSPARRRLAGRYAAAALIATLLAAFGGAALWLLWPAIACAFVALNYLGFGASGFQKHDGRLSPASCFLLLPYLVGAWLNSRAWTRRHPDPDPIADGVWLGRLPSRRAMTRGGFAALYDLAAELPAPHGNWRYAGQACLDLVAVDAETLAAAAKEIESLRTHGPLLVCCALGYSRSASAVIAWLLASGRVAELDAAVAEVAARRPRLVLPAEQRAALESFARTLT